MRRKSSSRRNDEKIVNEQMSTVEIIVWVCLGVRDQQ